MIASARKLLVQYWRLILSAAAMLAFLGYLMFYRLHSLVPALNTSEQASISSSKTISQIRDNPINAPYKLVDYLAQHYGHVHAIFLLRLVSVMVGFLILLAFYMVLRRRFPYYVAILGTALFGSSSWFLLVARLASPDILLMSIIALISVSILFHHSKRDRLASLFAVVVCSALLYVPGMLWFLVVGIAWQRKFITKSLDKLPIWIKFCAVALFAVIIIPIVWATVKNPSLLLTFAAIPHHFQSPLQYLKNLAEVPLTIFVRSPANPALWLGRLPLLDVFTTVLFALGVYCCWIRRKLEFSQVIFIGLILTTLLIALGGGVTVTAILPLIYIMATVGMAELLTQWLKVFPRNPLARGIGIGLITLAVISACYYQTTRYFVAWPNSTKTISSAIYKLAP